MVHTAAGKTIFQQARAPTCAAAFAAVIYRETRKWRQGKKRVRTAAER